MDFRGTTQNLLARPPASSQGGGCLCSGNNGKQKPMERTDPYLLVQGPAWADVQFYGQWLLTAGEAEAFWKKGLRRQVARAAPRCDALLE